MLSFSDALQDLQRGFAAALPARIEALRTQYHKLSLTDWRPADVQNLHHQLHGLTGSAGTFGMQSVSAAARQLEVRLQAIVEAGAAPDELVWQAIGAELARIEQLAHSRLEAGAPSLAPPQAPPRLDRAPRVYLVEDDIEQAQHLAQALGKAGYQVRVFTVLADFRAACAGAECPDAIVLDVIFPEGDSAGIELLAQLKAGRERCPPVVFASVRDDLDARLAAYRAGASRYLLKPVVPEALIDLLDALTGRMPAEPYRVLLVDDDPLLLQAQASVLHAAGMTVQALDRPRDTLDTLDTFRPDVVLLDVYMPGISGPELAAIVRERDEYLNLPILFLSAESDISQQLLALNLGGDDFLVKPVQADHLVSAVIARAQRARQNRAVQQRLRTTLYEREREHLALDQHAIVSIADAAGAITYVNDRFCEISGYARGELLGQNHRIIKSGQHPPAFYEALWQTIRAGRIWNGEICNRRKDGGLYWVASTITPFLDGEGRPYQYVSIRTDITRIKEQEKALRVYGERLRRSQIYANIGTWDWNIVTGELFWSERIASLFGYPEGELETTYENFLKAVHPDDRQAVIDAVNACVERDVPYEIEHRVVWPDGQVRWLLERGAVIRDAKGRALNMLGVVQDIDPRKRAELARAESERLLREAQSLARIGNWTADLVTGEMAWSDEIYRIVGHEPGSFTPSVEAFHAAVHPDDLGLVYDSERRTERTGRHDVIHRIVLPDGSIRHVHELARVEVDATGKPVRLSGTVQDVTERVEFEEALIASREEADRANQAKSEFLSSMSHELRTPMNAILGFSQLMECDPTLTGEHLDGVKEILKAGRHLLELINEVLDLAKIESGNIDLSLEPVEICPVVDECIGLVTPLAERRGIALSHAGLAGTAVRADRMRLKQALLNLLSNAIKYNREGGTVRVDVMPAGADRLRLRVTDTGQGIPGGRLVELFQPFSRLGAENTEIEGTGIGLTITRHIVEMMGGSVDVQSEVGVGSVFWIELPLESAGATGGRANAPAPVDVANAGRDAAASHTVLYIEDNPANIRLVAQILGHMPHIQLLTAHTPSLGIELALARRPALVLLDINLPGMDGYQVLKVFKAEAALAATPVIAITANAMPRDIERALAAGFQDHLAKPINVREFLASIDKHLAAPKGTP